MKKKVALSLDAQVVERSKEIAGLVPFSRYVESLLKKEISKAEMEQPAGKDGQGAGFYNKKQGGGA